MTQTVNGQELEDLLRVGHGMYNWLREMERVLGLEPEPVVSDYPFDILPFLRSGRTLCGIIRALFPEFAEPASCRALIGACGTYLKMDVDDLFTEADVQDVTHFYEVVSSAMKIRDSILDEALDRGVSLPMPYNPPTEERMRSVTPEREQAYLRSVKINAGKGEGEQPGRVRGFSPEFAAMCSNQEKPLVLDNGLEDGLEVLDAEQIVSELKQEAAEVQEPEEEEEEQPEKVEEAAEEVEEERAEEERVEEERAEEKLQIAIPEAHIPAIEEVRTAKDVKMLQRTLSTDDFALLEMRCRDEIERIKTRLEELHERSKTEYFDIWEQLLILSGKRHNLKRAARFQDPLPNIRRVFQTELQRNRELRDKCVELRDRYEQTEAKRTKIGTILSRVDESQQRPRDEMGARLEKLKRENLRLRAERLDLDVHTTNKRNEMNASFSMATKQNSINMSMRANAQGATPGRAERGGRVPEVKEAMQTARKSAEKFEVLRLYLDEERGKNAVLSRNVAALRASCREMETEIARLEANTATLAHSADERQLATAQRRRNQREHEKAVLAARTKTNKLNVDERIYRKVAREHQDTLAFQKKELTQQRDELREKIAALKQTLDAPQGEAPNDVVVELDEIVEDVQ